MPHHRTINVISLGAGVQSSAMLLMATAGELTPKPDLAVFADTGWEPPHIYQHLEWLREQTDIPVQQVSNGHNLYQDTWNGVALSGRNFTEIPVFVMNRRGEMKLAHRQCTEDYKIKPVRRAIRAEMDRRFGPHRNNRAIQWIGISLDEAHRMKDSTVHYVANRYPLVDAGLRRTDCLRWFQERYPDVPLYKSSCVGCPYHSDAQWLELSRQCPEQMDAAVRLDERLRSPERPRPANERGMTEFLHRSGRPLREVLRKLEQADQAGQQLNFLDGFGNECEGHCGL